MDSTGADSLLTELLYHLPRGRWWLLHEKAEHDNGLAKAFSRPRAEVQALLINAGVLLENGHGVTFRKKGWEAFYNRLQLDPACNVTEGTKGKVYYVAIDPICDTPAIQERERVRDIDRAVLPDYLISDLRESAMRYDTKKAEDARQKKAQADAAAKTLAAEKARAVQYPLLSQIIALEDDTSLNNPKVKEWVMNVMTEAFQLCKEQEADVTAKSSNGSDTLLLPLSRSSNSEKYLANDSKRRWLQRVIDSSIGDGMTKLEAIECIRKRLDIYEQEVVSDQSDSDDMNVNEDSSNTVSSYKNMYFATLVLL